MMSLFWFNLPQTPIASALSSLPFASMRVLLIFLMTCHWLGEFGSKYKLVCNSLVSKGSKTKF